MRRCGTYLDDAPQALEHAIATISAMNGYLVITPSMVRTQREQEACRSLAPAYRNAATRFGHGGVLQPNAERFMNRSEDWRGASTKLARIVRSSTELPRVNRSCSDRNRWREVCLIDRGDDTRTRQAAHGEHQHEYRPGRCSRG